MGRHHQRSTSPIESLERRRLLAAAAAVAVGETYFSDAPLPGTVRTTTSIGGFTYFGVRTASNGNLTAAPELWRTDGTPAGTSKVATLHSPFGSLPNSYPPPVSNFTNVGATTYFTEDRGGTLELWRTDGTAAGTTYLDNLSPSPSSSTIVAKDQSLIAFNNKLYFLNYNSTVFGSGFQLWTTTGAPSGLSAASTAYSFNGINGVLIMNNALFIAATNGLYKYDGSTLSRLSDQSGSLGIPPVVFNNKIYFAGNSTGFALYASDGTPGGTGQVTDAYWTSPGMAASGSLLFRAGEYRTGTNDGTELWATDGSAGNFHEVKDIWPGSGGSSPSDFTDVGGGKIFFTATDGVSGRELYVSDGTSDGTHIVKDIEPGSGSSSPTAFTPFDGKVYFTATTTANGRELWVSDGTDAGTHIVADFYPGPASSNPVPMRTGADGFYFGAVNPAAGYMLYTIAGADQPPVAIQDLNGGPLNQRVTATATADGNYYFVGGQALPTGDELYVARGTSGTALVRDIFAGSTGSSIASMIPFGTRVVFTATTAANGAEMWISDGTTANTTLVKDIYAGTNSSVFSSRVVLNGLVYFTANDGTTNSIWRSDGTTTGTAVWASGVVMSAPILVNGTIFYTDSGASSLSKTDGVTRTLLHSFPANGSTSIHSLAGIGNGVYFAGADGSSQQSSEPWKSDGTPAGTVMVKDILNSSIPSGSLPVNFAAANGWVLFDGFYDQTLNRALFRTDGTDAGTIRMDTLPGMPALFSMGVRISAFNRIILAASDGNTVHGQELWITDGTPAGTKMLMDIMPGTASSTIASFTRIDAEVYFTADDGVHGRELWMTDGTSAGTVRLTDINPGAASSDPQNLVNDNGMLYFTANDGVSPKVFAYVPYTADASGDYWVSPGGSVTLNASASVNLAPSSAATYEWDFDNDGQFDDASGVTPTFAAGSLAAGTYPVALRIRDAVSGLGVIDATATLTVGPPPGLSPDPAGSAYAVTGLRGAKVLIVSGGTSNIATGDLGDVPIMSVRVLNGAAITFDHAQHLTTLDAHDGRIALSSGGGQKVIVCRYVATTPAGTIDLADGNMVLLAASPSSIEPLIAAGRVVASSDAGGLRGPGVAAASQAYAIPFDQTALFAGETVTGRDILVKYTYRGDANLDGKINVDDYGRIDSSIPLGIAGWYNGDFNYDGKINVDDYGIIDSNIGIQGQPLASVSAGKPAPGDAGINLVSRPLAQWDALRPKRDQNELLA